MEKVKITQEQADAIEWLLNTKESQITEGATDWDKEGIVIAHCRCDVGWYEQASPLNHMCRRKLIKALYIGYEVEPRFKEDDYVVIKETGEVAQIQPHPPAFPYPDYLLSCNGCFTSHHVDELRHATKQEIWWFENNREVWQLKKGDIIRKFVVNGEFYEVTNVDGEFIGLFDIGRSRMETEEIDIVSGGYIVVCFTHDRIDI